MPPTAETDLVLAKKALLGSNLTLVVAKNGKLLYKSRSHGVTDLLIMIDALGSRAEGASLADSIIGRAAAMLCIYSKIVGVYGTTLSEGAVTILKAAGVRHEYGTLVPKILNRKKNDICPFDRAVSGIEDPRVALERLRSVRFRKS